jgi:hypothetical protein
VAPESNSGVISRLLSDAVEELKELEDEDAMARKEGRGDDSIVISLKKEMDARCIDVRLNRGWGGYELTP